MPLDDDAFQTVICASTVEHIGMDNTMYGSDEPRADDPPAEQRRAIAELLRVTAPGGRVFLTVPFGLREDHGWFRQFDDEDLTDLLLRSRMTGGRWRSSATTPMGGSAAVPARLLATHTGMSMLIRARSPTALPPRARSGCITIAA